MTLGIECLLCDDPAQARELAAVLDRINAERRAVQQQMVGEAETALATVPDVVATPRVAHCLFDAQWHPGVIGLVASKLKERLHRPVIAFAPSDAGSTVLRDRKSTRLNSSHSCASRMPSSPSKTKQHIQRDARA